MITIGEKAQELSNKNRITIHACFECKPEREQLKVTGGLFYCLICRRYYMNGGFINDNEHCAKNYHPMPRFQFKKRDNKRVAKTFVKPKFV